MIVEVDGIAVELLYKQYMVAQAGSEPFSDIEVTSVILRGVEITSWISDEYYGKFVKLCEKHFKES